MGTAGVAVKRSDVAEAMLNDALIAPGTKERLYGREGQCAYSDKEGEVVFDESSQVLVRYRDSFAVAVCPVASVEGVIDALHYYAEFGELPDERYI